MLRKFVLVLLLLATPSFAGLPPTTSKASGDTADLTTFKFRFPNFSVTHSGPTATFNVLSAAGGGTGLSSLTAHCVLVGNGTGNATLVCPSTSGHVLTSNGAAADPSFQAAPGGSSTLTVATKTSAYTLTNSDDVILCNGTFTITLQAVASATIKPYRIKNIGTGECTIDANGSETIDGDLTLVISTQNSAVEIIPDGSAWYVF